MQNAPTAVSALAVDWKTVKTWTYKSAGKHWFKFKTLYDSLMRLTFILKIIQNVSVTEAGLIFYVCIKNRVFAVYGSDKNRINPIKWFSFYLLVGVRGREGNGRGQQPPRTLWAHRAAWGRHEGAVQGQRGRGGGGVVMVNEGEGGTTITNLRCGC